MRRAVFLTNFVPPYRIPILEELTRHIPEFRVLVSVPMEANRCWRVNANGIEVIQQRSISFRIRQRYQSGVVDEGYLHIPYDTLFWLRRLRPEAILTGEMGSRTVQAILYRELFNNRSRVIVHADVAESTELNRGKMRSYLRRWILRHADAVIVNGASGERYIRSLAQTEEKIFRVPYTTDVVVFAAAARKRHPKAPVRNLVYVGRMVEGKGLRVFAEALAMWAQKHPERLIRWTLVGDGPLRHELESLEKPANLEMHFTGPMTYAHMPEVYAKEDVLVLPTFADTWGLVVNEAMAAGLPVLGSLYSQAVEELVEDGATGWTFYPDDLCQVYNALDRAMRTQPDQLAVMRDEARKRALQLTPEVVAQRLLGVMLYAGKTIKTKDKDKQ